MFLGCVGSEWNLVIKGQEVFGRQGNRVECGILKVEGTEKNQETNI